MKREDSSGTEEYYLIMYFKDTFVNHLLQKFLLLLPAVHMCMTTDAAINLVLLHHLL